MPDVNSHRLKDSMKRFMRLFLFSLEPFTKGTANTRANWIFDGSNPLFQFRRWRASSSAAGRLFVHGTSNGIARVYTSSTRYTKHLKRAKCCPCGVQLPLFLYLVYGNLRVTGYSMVDCRNCQILRVVCGIECHAQAVARHNLIYADCLKGG